MELRLRINSGVFPGQNVRLPARGWAGYRLRMRLESPVEPPGKEPSGGASKYSVRWSQGFTIAGIIATVIWGLAYNVLDNYAEKWWYNFAIAFVLAAALVTVSVLTCFIAEFLESRDRKKTGGIQARPGAGPG